MKRGILIVLTITMLFVVIAPPVSHAWGRGHGYSGHHGGHGWALPGAIAGGLLMGAAIGSILAPPVYAPPPPPRVYYYPPPPPPRAYYHRHAPRVVYVYPY